ncbi:hypothetical protein MKW98_032445 [Papaver atlanticum]|uniref:Uncharacterized protein n=1 Tax=Papaver atlanticum TaxID=357466 RepID=A0AAD4SW48_9MAGN|nr:hypothetical protein MKW98_032445 [Papaver atlanticum]
MTKKKQKLIEEIMAAEEIVKNNTDTTSRRRRKRKLQYIVFFAVIKGWEEPDRYVLLGNHQRHMVEVYHTWVARKDGFDIQRLG